MYSLFPCLVTFTHTNQQFTTQSKCNEYFRPMSDKMSRNRWLIFWHFQVYNPTGFNKIEKVVKYNQTDIKLTVWDTSGEDNDVYFSFLSASNTSFSLRPRKVIHFRDSTNGHYEPRVLNNFWNVWWVCWLIITQVIVSGRSSLGNFDKASVIDSKPKTLRW